MIYFQVSDQQPMRKRQRCMEQQMASALRTGLMKRDIVNMEYSYQRTFIQSEALRSNMYSSTFETLGYN